MKRLTLLPLALPLLIAAAPAQITAPTPALAPSEIIAAAAAQEWVSIAPSDLLVMDLAPDAKNRTRRVVIQLMPSPFSQGWVGNIRKLAAAHWWDGLSINRVQDNYVVQWGDADGEDVKKAKALPPGLVTMPQKDYAASVRGGDQLLVENHMRIAQIGRSNPAATSEDDQPRPTALSERDVYAWLSGHYHGWPVASNLAGQLWPIHCYAAVGVGRNLPPDTGSGAELYTVIGHAPRHLDRNIAVIGRVIEGIEHLSSLPRGTGALGFYETAEERVPILSVRLGSEVSGLPGYQYLSTESASFTKYADARANRRDAFFIRPAGGADICNIPVPLRRVK